MHHVLHVAESEDGVQQTACLRSFKIDLLDAPFKGCAYEPADNTLARAVSLMLRADVDIHQIGAMA